jgi:protein gp37
MGESTKIQWADSTVNPSMGCERPAPVAHESTFDLTAMTRISIPAYGPCSRRFGGGHEASRRKWSASF